MPVFNAAESQVLFKPVTAYKQGQAFRANMEQAEATLESTKLQNKALKQEIEGTPARLKAAAEEVEREIKEHESKIRGEAIDQGADLLALRKERYGPIIDSVKERLQNGGDIDMSVINQELRAEVNRVGGEDLENFTKFAGEDGVLDEVEFTRFAKVYGIQQEVGSPSDRAKRAVEAGLTPGSPEYNAFVLNEGGDSGRQRDDEIASAEAIFEAQGHPDPHTAAVKFVDKGKQVLMSPTDNTVYEYDKFTKKLDVLEPEDSRGAEPEIAYENTLHSLAEEATGIGPGAKSAAAAGFGPLGIYTANATTKAKAKFKAAENSLIEAFRLNPRYPNAEIKRITDNIDIKPKFWDSAEQMRSRMDGSREFLEEELAAVEWNLQNPAITAKEKYEEESTRRGIKKYLRVLGEPQSVTAIKANAEAILKIDTEIAEIDAQIEAQRLEAERNGG